MTWSEKFEALKGMAVDAAQAAGKKTKQLANVAKTNLEIRSEEEKIKKAQLELGKLYYRDFVVGEEPDAAEYLPWCEKITESKELIETLKASLEAQEEEVDFDEDGACCEEGCCDAGCCEEPVACEEGCCEETVCEEPNIEE